MDNLAKRFFDAYQASLIQSGIVLDDGIPDWDDLPREIKDAYDHGVQAVLVAAG